MLCFFLGGGDLISKAYKYPCGVLDFMQPRGQMHSFCVLKLSDGKEKEDFPFMGKGESPEKCPALRLSEKETSDLSPGLPLPWPVAFLKALPLG